MPKYTSDFFIFTIILHMSNTLTYFISENDKIFLNITSIKTAVKMNFKLTIIYDMSYIHKILNMLGMPTRSSAGPIFNKLI